MGLGTVGPVEVFSARGTPVSLRRTEGLARDDHAPAVFLGLQVTGTNVVGQYGRRRRVGPGSLVVFESIAPYSLSFEQGVDYLSLRIPRETPALPERVLRAVTVTAFRPANPTGRGRLPVRRAAARSGGGARGAARPADHPVHARPPRRPRPVRPTHRRRAQHLGAPPLRRAGPVGHQPRRLDTRPPAGRVPAGTGRPARARPAPAHG
ncbi:hypothetical protein ACF06N_22090 [Streptomyces albidoflavus]